MIRRFLHKKALARCFFILAKLNKLLFEKYIYTDLQTDSQGLIKKITKLRRLFFRAISQTRRLKLHSIDAQLLQRLDNLFELIFSSHLLYSRLKDPNIFSICAREFFNLEKTSSTALRHIAFSMFIKKNNLVFERLLEDIQTLESLFLHTLKVVLPDPVVFIIFIQDLYTLREKLIFIKNILCPSLLQLPDPSNK